MFALSINLERGRVLRTSPPLSTLYSLALDPDHAVNELQLIGQSPRILVVDDNDDNRYTLSLYLELEGYSNLKSAHDGEDAIAHLNSTPIDLVLLDVMMPKVDGYQVLTWIKEQPRLRELPVIMISALNEMSSVIAALSLVLSIICSSRSIRSY